MKTGILLINLGTPEAPDAASVRRYLKEFLSDPRVIEKRGILWWMILNLAILPRHSKKSAAAYGQIWNQELDESPLKTVTRSQANKIAARFGDDRAIVVEWAMRYGAPSIASGLKRLTGAGCAQVLLFPLYPQYSGATTGTALDKAYDALKTLRHHPALRTVPPYYANPAYIHAIASDITTHVQSLDWRPDHCLVSFHGLPESFIQAGDPYQSHCEATFARLQSALGADDDFLRLTYQSRGRGRARWTGPQLEETLVELAGKGVKNLCVVTPGFVSDCIETLEEVQIRAAQAFRAHGGANFSFVPCLNDSDAAIGLMHDLICKNLTGWR